MQAQAGMHEVATARARARASRPQASRKESMLAWSVVAAVHAVLFWWADQALMPQPQPADAQALTLVWLPPPPAPPSPREEVARAPAPAPATSAATQARPPAAARVPAPSARNAAEPTADTGLTAVDLGPAPPPPVVAADAPARAPWDAPPPPAKPFASRAPTLPGQGAQRFRMQPPRSIAATVERVGRMFGGGGPSDCAETRNNIRDLAVLGAEAVAQELEEERRNCRN